MIEKKFKKAYQQWVAKDGLLHCPKCASIHVLHISVPEEGELLFCKKCSFQTKIGEENQKIRKGFTL